VRAERFAALGLIDMLHPDDLSPAALGAWMAKPGRAATPGRLDTGGLDRFAELAAAALGHVPPVVDAAA
jgi:predicted glycosyltransferase